MKPKKLWNIGFVALLITQFTVAFNDNAFRWLLVPIGKEYVNGDFIRLLGGIFLVIPFLLWTSIAGYITDKYSRRNVIFWCKFAEFFLLTLAVAFIAMGPEIGTNTTANTSTVNTASWFAMPLKLYLLLGVLFLIGSQAAMFSPSKYGTIPDLVPETSISAANGMVTMLTMLASVSGQVAGGFVFVWTTFYQNKVPTGIPGGNQLWITALVLCGMALLGLVSSIFIPKMKAAAPEAKFPRNPLWQTGKDIAALFSHHKLFWVAIASAFFWGVAALAQINVDKYADEFLKVQQNHITVLAAVLTIGIGIGAVFCGFFSGKRIELGLVPLGAFGMGFFIILLGFTPHYAAPVARGAGTLTGTPYLFGCVIMLLAGLWAGLYDIPLASYIQEKSPKEQRGRMIAAYNFCTFTAMLLFMGLGFAGAWIFNQFSSAPSLYIWICLGSLAIVVALIQFYWFDANVIIFVLRSLLQLIYRPKFVGTENIPEEGPVLLVSNHVSLLDGLLLYIACPRNVRFLAYAKMVPKMFEPVARETGLIKILPGNPKNIINGIRQAREALKNGDVVGIFAEGGITRNGQMKAFEPGFLSILKGCENAVVIPVHINGLFGSMFSYKYGTKEHNGADIKLRPRKLDNDVIIAFGKPITNPQYPQQVQRAVQELGIDAYKKYNKKKLLIPARTLIRSCRKRGNRMMFTDSGGTVLSGYKFLTAVLIARKLLRRKVLASRQNEPHVGILAPMSVGGCLLNAALTVDKRVPVNLNFTFGSEGINRCIHQAGIKHVITSRKVLERMPHLEKELDAELICAENLLAMVSLWTKIDTFLDAVLFPNWLHELLLGLRSKKLSEELVTIIYTSGSTGKPKGVMLTNDNLAEVGRGTVAAFFMGEKDIVLGFLPFFHAFGLMGNFWLPIFCGGAGVYHFNPLEPKKIGEMAAKYSITFAASTPTFLRNYLRKCPRDNFAHIPMIMCGAEKVPLDLMDGWEEKYGVRPSEGFGATELSPMPCANIPDTQTPDNFHCYRKDGSIGRTILNVMIKVIGLETGEDLPPNEIGMIVVKGPIVMKGYYNEPKLTDDVLKDDWYHTGDVGKMDEDGFTWITGRQTRISKIGGEMIPHVLIEEEILKIVSEARKKSGDNSANEGTNSVDLAVTALPHPVRGERIVILCRELPVEPQEIVNKMIEGNLPNLWIPRAVDFKQVEEIPVLGTGKLDLAALKQKADELFG